MILCLKKKNTSENDLRIIEIITEIASIETKFRNDENDWQEYKNITKDIKKEIATNRFIKAIPLLYKLSLLQDSKIVDYIEKIGEENSKQTIKYIKSVIKSIMNCNYEELDVIKFQYKLNSKISNDELYALGGIVFCKENIKNELLVKEPVNLVYYTSIESALHLFVDGDKKIKNNLVMAVMNVDHMNDPNEGKVLKEKIIGTKQSSNKPSNVYVKCFTKEEDFLPMWSTYGDNAKGCSITIDSSTIKRDGKPYNKIYRVVYCSGKGNGIRVSRKNYGFKTRRISNLVTRIKKYIKQTKAFNMLLESRLKI